MIATGSGSASPDALEHRSERGRETFGRDAQVLDRDHLARNETEEAACAVDGRLGEQRLCRGLEEPVLGEAATRVGGAVVLFLDGVDVLVGQHCRRLEGDEAREQREGVGNAPEIAITLRVGQRAPRFGDDIAHRHRGEVDVTAVGPSDEFLEGPVKPGCVHHDRGGSRVLPLHRYMVRRPGVALSRPVPSSSNSAARARAASVLRPDISRAIS